MSEMVERIALRLAGSDPYAHMPEYRRRAREIIADMRDPTPAMIVAFEEQPSGYRLRGRPDVKRAWRAMLDAALAE